MASRPTGLEVPVRTRAVSIPQASAPALTGSLLPSIFLSVATIAAIEPLAALTVLLVALRDKSEIYFLFFI
ncbi:hypothetical protein Baya_1265 [Bagarius yarrelli]|uniref:Uncharacterized protein n=1 Tax=Bagarius yarrelli TaxID=175774 RepID=A0A556TKL8_BAGYA|nr:hypothetical protein Baya_1265 [Bagarius yarrelli]